MEEIKPYRTRKKVLEDCVKSGAMTEQEAKLLNKSVVRADNSYMQGKHFINLQPYNEILTKKFEDKVAKGEITEKQKKTLHLMRICTIHKPHLNIVEEVEKSCEDYVRIGLEDNIGLAVSGLSLALGFTVKELKQIASGEIKTPSQNVIKAYMQMIEANTELAISESGGVGAMFLAKNHFGLSDKQEVEVKHTKEEMTDEQLSEKYNNIDVIDVD